jgi:hypothetical protein
MPSLAMKLSDECAATAFCCRAIALAIQSRGRPEMSTSDGEAVDLGVRHEGRAGTAASDDDQRWWEYHEALEEDEIQTYLNEHEE